MKWQFTVDEVGVYYTGNLILDTILILLYSSFMQKINKITSSVGFRL